MDIKNNIVATEQFVEDQLLNNQSDWSQSDSSQKNYVKNRTHYDDTESGGDLKKLHTKYLQDEVVTCNSAKVGQTIVVKAVNDYGIPIKWEAVNAQNNRDYLVLKDKTTGYEYMVYVDQGSLESRIKASSIRIAQLPDKTEYSDTDEFDPTGMIVMDVDHEGNDIIEVTDYTYNKYVAIGSTVHEIRYTEDGVTFSTEIPITTRTLAVALQDFTYTANEDGTYTITGWNQTLNGEASTVMVIPNSELVIV